MLGAGRTHPAAGTELQVQAVEVGNGAQYRRNLRPGHYPTATGTNCTPHNTALGGSINSEQPTSMNFWALAQQVFAKQTLILSKKPKTFTEAFC